METDQEVKQKKKIQSKPIQEAMARLKMHTETVNGAKQNCVLLYNQWFQTPIRLYMSELLILFPYL